MEGWFWETRVHPIIWVSAILWAQVFSVDWLELPAASPHGTKPTAAVVEDHASIFQGDRVSMLAAPVLTEVTQIAPCWTCRHTSLNDFKFGLSLEVRGESFQRKVTWKDIPDTVRKGKGRRGDWGQNQQMSTTTMFSKNLNLKIGVGGVYPGKH